MVLPTAAPRRSSASFLSTWLIRISMVVLLGIIYVVSTSRPPSDDNQHWSPPFLDFILGPSHDTPPPRTKGATAMNPPASGKHGVEIKNSINVTAEAAPINVPKLHSKLKLTSMGDSTEHVGIMVDAGRHYFTIEWLEAFLEYMAGLGFNWLHLRLTDDQAFALATDEHPAQAAPFYGNQVYTAEQLKGLVALATKLGITIVPEINVPGHAASWGADLIVPCPRFICTYGYGIPLNIESPKLLPVIKDILTQLASIFGTKYLHLGGDEVDQSEGCFQEIGQSLPDYERFETKLASMVQDELGFEHVLRWEQNPNSTLASITKRAGGITQYWRKSIDDYSDDELQPQPFFASPAGLYMDVNGNDNAFKIYQEARKSRDRTGALGVVVGTFELSEDWFMDRNVFGRMIAVSMAFSGDATDDDETAFLGKYQSQCTKLLGKDSSTTLCQRNGEPVVPYQEWREKKWDKTSLDWKLQVCTRLTDPGEARAMRNVQPFSDKFNTRQAEEIALARTIFLSRLQKRKNKPIPERLFKKNQYGNLKLSEEAYFYKPRANRNSLFKHRIGHTGVTVDLSRYFFPLVRLEELVERLSKLGFNTLHLRLVDDFAFAVKTKSHPDIAWASRPGGNVYTMNGFRDLVEYGHARSVEIIPEINVVARAGGWFAGGFIPPCPNHICDQGYGIPLNLTNVPVMAVVSNIIEEFRVAFNSPFLHLGYDERKESMPCLKEARIKVDFDVAEQKMLALLSVLNISPGLVLRWESSEDVSSDTDRMRAGAITHYHYSNPPKDASIPFFVSTDVRFDRSNDDAYAIYQTARKYATEHEMILGLLAGTMEMSPSAWNGRNVEGKLVALAMGLSATKSDLDLEEFKKLYTKTCYELKIEGDTATKLFGKSRWTEDRWQEELESERLRRSNSTCSRMTGEVPSRKMKDETLA